MYQFYASVYPFLCVIGALSTGLLFSHTKVLSQEHPIPHVFAQFSETPHYKNWQGNDLNVVSPPIPTVTSTALLEKSVTSSKLTFLDIPVVPFTYTTAIMSANGTLRTFSRQSEVGLYVEEGLNLPRGAIKLEMVAIEGGTFMMGSQDSEGGGDDEKPQHQVTVPDFFMGRYEITQAQYATIMGTNPSLFQGENNPVENVSWNDANEFIKRLNRLTPGQTYRLPTEAEWEYAARAGTSTPFSYGETITSEAVNYGSLIFENLPKGERPERTISVDKLPANPWGLQHIHGNVWEWCADQWHSSYSEKPRDIRINGSIAWVEANRKISPLNDLWRVLRGGSWLSVDWYTRSTTRSFFWSGFRYHNIGFRVVLVRQGTPKNGFD